MMTKRILLVIPFLIAVAKITRCWTEIITSDTWPRWQHFSAIICMSIAVYLYFQSLTHAAIAIGVFLIIGTLNGFSMTLDIETTKIGIFGIYTPPFNSLSLGLLSLYCLLNFVTLINLQLDYKERKSALKTKKQAEAKLTETIPQNKQSEL
jgi:hypothetical protein